MDCARRLIAGIALVSLSAAVVFAATGRDDLSPADQARVKAVTAPARTFDAPEKFEALPAGAATVRKFVNADIFSHPSDNLSFEERSTFSVGNGLFRKDWVSAPSSTQAFSTSASRRSAETAAAGSSISTIVPVIGFA